MPTQLIAKLIELAYNEAQSGLSGHEIEDRLVNNLLGKELSFATERGEEGAVKFHGLGRGKRKPSTVVTLQLEGIEFKQDEERLSLDLRYVFYREYGYDFLFGGTSTKFLITSPFVQKLGPSNYLLEFVVYGDTTYQINRCLSVFAAVVQAHQGDLHQTAIDWCDNQKSDRNSELEISLKEPITEVEPAEEPLEYLYNRSNDESYIEEYIDYIENPRGDTRKLIDNRNTYAESKM